MSPDLRLLRATLLSWRGKALSANALIGLGEVLESMDEAFEDPCHSPEIAVTLTLGFSVRGDDCTEGIYASLSVNGDGVFVDDLRTQSSPDYGSDHFSTIAKQFNPMATFRAGDVLEWFDLVDELINDSRTILDASRDHI